MTVVDYPDFATPQANATAISTTGVPLLALAGTLLTSQVFTLTGGQTQNSAVIPITQLGYEISLSCQIGNAATVPFVDAILLWMDPTGNVTIAQEKWILPCQSTGSFTITGTGPTKGAQLKLRLVNEDPAVTATVTAVILTNSRVYTRDRWIPSGLSAVPTFTTAGGDPRTEALALIDGLSVPNGTTATRIFPTYHGDVLLYVDQAGVSAANSTASLSLVPSGSLGAAALWSGQPTGGIGLGTDTLLRLPRAPTLFKFVNAGTGAGVLNVRLIMLDDRY